MVQRIGDRFGSTMVIDRRARPSHGYRAVHVLVDVDGRKVEVQIRTAVQHLWAELSEKLSDAFGVAVKYGGGPPAVRSALDHVSLVVSQFESDEAALGESLRSLEAAPTPEVAVELDALQATRRRLLNEARSLLEQAIAQIARLR